MKVEAMITQNNSVDIYIDERKYIVPNHWFWPEFADSWEPQTHTFFERNLKKDTSFLDIGGWIGPTALIATELGAKKVIIVEPNPINFMKLIQIQFSNLGLLERWTLLNVCVANSRGFTQIGPVEGVINSSSATNIRDQSGVEVMSILLTDLINPKEDYSLIKVDIEGAEELVVSDLRHFLRTNAAIWLSIHPPFYQNKENFYKNLSLLESDYFLTNENNDLMPWSQLEEWISSDEKNPSWGTKWGNFFEIGLLPKKAFNSDGKTVFVK